MKKLLCLIPVMALAFLLMGFTDLPEDHWAAGAVQTLVDEGTVSGFTDGTFRPNDPVTRAQFVKMLGYRLDEPRKDYVVDLTRLHWAYDNLRYSPLRLIDGRLKADDPATREQVAVYLYDCYGGGGEGFAPSVITSQTDYPVEVGWVYDNGIMCGDDGIHLRLSDGLTRAEAAALIVKSRSAHTADFADAVSDLALARVFNSSALFDVEYDPSAVLTNGQIARAAYRLWLDRISALWYNEKADFEHPYADDLKAMEPVLGGGRISAAFADSPAMPEDALAMLGYGVATKIYSGAPYGAVGIYYKDARLPDKALDPALTWLWSNGIRPYGAGLLKSGQPVTHKMIAAALLQCDMLWGLQTSVTVDADGLTYNDEPMRYDGLPANAALFQSLPADVPLAVFGLPFVAADGREFVPQLSPSVNYPFYYDLREAFANELVDFARTVSENGVNVKFTYYPQLVYDNGGGLTMRVKVEPVGGTVGELRTVFENYLVYAADNEVWIELPLSYTFMLE